MSKRAIIAAVFIVAAAQFAAAQDIYFGKNKVQYKKFDWEFIQTDHFDVYYSQEGYELAVFAANAAEDAYKRISSLLRYQIANRIPIVIYNSHNEFQQTNVIDEYMEEGIGGVTELFKNRIVLPFEGDYKQFRHVIHHELVHGVLNDMFYGGTIQSILSSRAPVIIPIWMNEGFSEYSSLKWDTNTDMFIRDATVNNYLPDISQLGGYFAYRGGQAVFHYIATKYGEQKIGELFNRMKSLRSVEGGFKSTFGLTIDELSERWQREMRRTYYPDVGARQEPLDIARQLTDRKKDQNFYNSSPAISPQGDKIAFLTDRDDYFDIYLMSAIDGKIIKKVVAGQRTRDFEELHLLTPAITWSPDGKKIALAAKSGGQDAIMIVDVESGDVERLSFEFNGIFSVDWSRDGDKLTFVGANARQSDIFVYSFTTKELKNLTDDIFSDFDPVFSPDGKTVYFSSDRGAFVDRSMIPRGFRMQNHDYSQRDLYAVDIETMKMKRLTDTPLSDEGSTVSSPDGRKLLFVSDRNGINNVYELNLSTGLVRPVTNSLSGVYQLSISYDGTKLVFASLTRGGFDIYLLRTPFEKKLDVAELDPTAYMKQLKEQAATFVRTETPKTGKDFSADTIAVKGNIVVVTDTSVSRTGYEGGVQGDYSSFIFTPQTIRKDSVARDTDLVDESLINTIDAEGNYIPRRYKLNFSPDLIYGTAAYSTFYGVQGSTIMAFSDMLGDHRIIFQTNLLLDLKNSDYGLTYLYLPYRVDFGVTAFHSARFLYLTSMFGDINLYRFRTWAIGLSASYPIDRFNRVDMDAYWLNLSRENLDILDPAPQRRSFVLPQVSYVHDNSIWQGGWFAPNNGTRWIVSAMGSTKYSDESLDFYTLMFDYRDYNRLARDLIFVYRLTGGLSNGRDRQSFFIGGTDGWINRRFDSGNIPIENIEDYAFLTPVLPLRGYNYNVLNGTRFGLANVELRFPLIRYLIFGALPIGFQNILGAYFIDVGSAWSDESKWRAFRTDKYGRTTTSDLLMGTGFGLRLGFLGLPLRIDVAWNFNWQEFSHPVWYFSLGPEF